MVGTARSAPGEQVSGVRLALTSAQYGIWLGQQLDAASPAYWTAEAVELSGPLDAAHFEAALRQAMRECDSLHMRFASDGDAVWQTPDPQEDWPFARHDMSDAEAQLWMQADLRQPADLAHGPLFASALLQLAPEKALWYLRVHHIALDGFAYAMLAQRVAALYSARSANTDAPPARAGKLDPVVAEDAAYLASPAYARDRDFWMARMADAGAPAMLAPPATFARGVRRVRGGIATSTIERCQAVASAAGVDWAAVLIAATGAWLRRHSSAGDLTLGLPVMGRLGSVALTIPCMAMNILPLRLAPTPSQSLADLARAVAAEMKAIRPHQRYRYEHLKHDLGMSGGTRRLFGAVVNLMPFDRPPAFGPLHAVSHPVSAGPVEDLSITIAPGTNSRIDIEANPDAYDEATLHALHQSLLTALTALLEQPDTALATILGQAPHATPALLSGGVLPIAPPSVLTSLLTHDAHKTALIHGDVELSYAELVTAVQNMAGRLRDAGVTEESRVVLLLPRSVDTIVAMLAIMWAGGGYVPLDPDGPALRVAAVLEDVKPTLVVSLRKYALLLPTSMPLLCIDDAMPCTPMVAPLAVADSALAYIIYTSGSTGRPNGVMIERAALAHFGAGATARYQVTANDRVLQFAPLHFDASVEEIFLTLGAGATLILRDDAMLESLERFIDACARLRISVLDLPTAFWHELAFHVGQHGAPLPDCLRLVIIGGEAALAERVARWRTAAPSHLVLLNTYGPTEATVICTTAQLAGPDAIAWSGEAVPIGRPLPGVDIAVCAEHPVGIGEEGELCLIGAGLARGYFDREALTAQRFVTLPDGRRAYRTGDRVVLGEDGQLRYLGRLDDEVKISGHRIDPTEIEAALLQYPGVREAAVVCQQQADGGKHLRAFVATAGKLNAPALRAFLAERLPAAAVPANYASLARLPRNANGKIDRSALRARELDAAPTAPDATPLEQSVMSVWREVLGVEALTPMDDFFALGGKSLQAIQVANRLGAALKREVAVSALFRHRTVAALAHSLGTVGHAPPAAAAGGEFAPLLTIQRGSGPALFCVHPAEGLSWCYLGLAAWLPHTPIYGLQARGMSGTPPADIDMQLDDYLGLIRGAQPHGPYRLIGWSSGGGLAHALAARLQAAGETVSLLAMMDSYPSDIWEGKPEAEERDALIAMLDVIGASSVDADGQPLPREALLAQFRRPGSSLATADDAHLERITTTALLSMHLYRQLRHPRYEGDVLFFHASRRGPDAPDWKVWTPYVNGQLERIDVDCTHSSMSQPAPLGHIGRVLAQRIDPEGRS
ncbi:amino acid adenylation domain-containing protein [Massilia antarctica]|uniref:Amino acid adenylation domain-containing protein n=1 Tax=Massilia antarctica TaxID=2765360 RepID=A0AA48WJI4_9BURK|nr:amino acid adenylation domain-containing protein [Massilia antarctica]